MTVRPSRWRRGRNQNECIGCTGSIYVCVKEKKQPEDEELVQFWEMEQRKQSSKFMAEK
jgi:Fe-S-cluster-containing dehydrogenase component